MEYRNLGSSGVKVSEICLGTAFRGAPDESVCVETIHRAIDLGCNFIDCANIYQHGRSEEILGRALKGKRDGVVLTTKARSPVGQAPNDQGLSRYHIMREIDRSLKRLQTDHVDVYICHAWDPGAPLEETFRAMDDLVTQGKTRYVGISNFSAWQTVESLWTCDRNGLDRFVVLQNEYNLLNRWEIERDVLQVCHRHGIGMMTYSATAIGLLTGRYRRGQPPPPDGAWGAGKYDLDRALTQQNDRVIQALVDIGKARGRTPAQVAVAWVLDHPEVTSAMIGPDSPEQVDESFGAVGWRLTEEERARLDEVSEPTRPQRYL